MAYNSLSSLPWIVYRPVAEPGGGCEDSAIPRQGNTGEK